jgi:hypothetical protein
VLDDALQEPLLGLLNEGVVQAMAPAAPSPQEKLARDLLSISNDSGIVIERMFFDEWSDGRFDRRCM